MTQDQIVLENLVELINDMAESRVVRRRAGIEKWDDAFQVMRRNRETDWGQVYPQYVVSTWIGHGIQVSARHYLQVPQELYDKAAGANKVQTATKSSRNKQKKGERQ